MNINVSKRHSFRLSPLVSLFLLPLSPVQQKYLSLEGYTVSMPRATPGDSRRQGKNSLEGYTPAKMAAVAAAPPLSRHFPFKIGVWVRTQLKLDANLKRLAPPSSRAYSPPG